MGEQWFRHKWLGAIYESDLDPIARHVAEIFAGKARQDSIAWEPLSNLVMKTGRTKKTCIKARQTLIDGGWLVEVKASTHKAASHFLLVIPSAEGCSQYTPQADGGVEPVHPRGVATTPQRGTEYTPRGVATTPSQSVVNPDQSILSPEQLLVRDLLDLDDGDERVMKVPQLLTKHKPDSPKPWLRGCHKTGDLLDLLDDLVSGKEETGFAPEPDDDKFMDNPHYVEAHGNAQRVRVEDFYRHKIGDLGFLHFEIEDMLKETQRNTSATTAKEVWEDVLQRAHRDVEDHPRCDECSVRIDEGHGRRCSQRKRHYCESCGAEVHMSHFSGLFPCPKCKRKHQPLQQTA